MDGNEQSWSLILRTSLQAATAELGLVIVLALTVVLTQSAQAQNYTVLHSFTGGVDGANPWAGLTMDGAGNLYGTTFFGGYSNGDCDPGGCGAVFKLTHKASGWVFSPLYSFLGDNDGASPQARVTVGPNGILYGTTFSGGGWNGGTVFSLRPPAAACKTALCSWNESVLHSFANFQDGFSPGYGDVVFDPEGNLYGTTYQGGSGTCGVGPCGVVYKLTPSNGGWTESVLYNFTGTSSGNGPYAAVIFDQAGNLYGTTSEGGNGGCNGLGCGTVFQLTPSGSGWTENVLYAFQNGSDGATPIGGLIFDRSGNLYGATSGPENGKSTVFELTPSSGNWTFAMLYSLGGSGGPTGSLIMDTAGNLYGTALSGGAYGSGSVFKLAPSGGGWTYTSLHDFCAGGPPCSDGAQPWGNVILDANGNLYGTASAGGPSNYGVVWEITP